MILIDANLLVYAIARELPENRVAGRWLDDQIANTPHVGMPWPSILAFIRLSTNPRIFQSPATVERAWRQVREWTGQASVWIPQPTERHQEVFELLLPEIDGRGTLIHDAHLAALAIEHGLVLCSSDGDFARFRALRWWNPIADPKGGP